MKKYFYISVLFSLLITGCANQLPPGGGLADTTPPEVVDVYPPDGTINFEDDHIEVTFSEYVDKRTVKDAVFISPAIEGNPEFEWTNTSVKITFPFDLKPNTTYIVNLGTDIVDYNNKNRLSETFALSFSTGEYIDKKFISGTVLDEEKQGIMIFAYKMDSLKAGLNPTNTKPDYISQSGSDGSYKVSGLPAGTFRLYAVKDEFRDLLFNAEQDKIGMPVSEIVLTEADTAFTGLDFYLSTVDSIAPRISSAAMTDKEHLLITFSENVDSTYIRNSNFFIYDSTAKNRVNVLYSYQNTTKPSEAIIVFKDSLIFNNDNYLFADSLRDNQGNLALNEGILFTVNTKPDTSKPIINMTIPENNSKKVSTTNQVFSFYLNDAIDTSLIARAVMFTDTNKVAIPVEIKGVSPANFTVRPVGKLKENTDYTLKVNHKFLVDAAGNSLDSVFVYKFKTVAGLDFTGVTGKLSGVDISQNPYLVLQNAEDPEKKYFLKLTSESKFTFEKIEPAKYKLWLFYDADGDGKYSTGTHYPYKPAEKFYYHKEDLTLRARWVVTDVNFIVQ